MSDAASNAVGVVIILLMLVFLGIWIWAWLPHHKKNFDLLARMPMLDSTPRGNDAQNEGVTNEDYR